MSNTFDSFTIEVIGSNTLTGNITYTFPGGQGTYSTITFKRGDNTQDCSLTIDNVGYPISGFSDSSNPGLDGFSWYHEANTNVYTIATDYNLTIDGKRVTSASASNITGANITGTVTYNAATSTLTLVNATIESQIQSGLSSLTIHFKGTNTIRENSVNDAIIPSNGNDNATLILEGEMDGDINSTLTINGAVTPIKNFASVTLSGAYLSSDIPFYYAESQDGSGEKMYYSWNYPQDPFEVEFTTEVKYPLWINGKQVTAANATNVLSSTHNNKVAFSAGTENTLMLKGLIIDGNGIFCGLDNLTIDLQGENVLQSNDALCLIKSCNESAPLIFTTSGTTEPKLTLTNKDTSADDPSVIEGFASVTIPTDLSWTDNNITPHNVSYNSTLKLVTDFSTDPIAHDVTLAPTAYPVIVAGTQVNTFNAGDVLGDGTANTAPTVSYEPSTNTLTLENATLTDEIKWESNEALTISIKGTNSIDVSQNQNANVCIRGNSTDPEISFVRGDATNDCSLSLTCHVAQNTLITGFSNSDAPNIENGMYWSPIMDGNGYVSSATFGIDYGLNIAGVQVTSANASDITGQNIGATNTAIAYKVSYEYDSKTLTLENAEIIGGITCSDDLTISVLESNSLSGDEGYISTTNNSATLTFKGATNVASSLSLDNDRGESAVIGFASVNVQDAYFESSNPYEYNTTERKLINPTMESIDIRYKITEITVTTSACYPLWIGSTQVKSSNAGSLPANVTFTAGTASANNKLTLTGATINYPIVSGLDNLDVEFSGENYIGVNNTQGTSYSAYISSIDSTATITFRNTENNSSVNFYNSVNHCAVEGFAHFTLADGVYYNTSHGSRYDENVREFRTLDNYYVQNLTITTDVYYPLWVDARQASSATKDDVLSDGSATVQFDGDKTLTLNGVSISSSSVIESCLDNLTIYLKGVNSLTTYTYGHSPIASGKSTATLTIAKAPDATGDVSLYLEGGGNPDPPVVSGFSSVSLTGLNFDTGTTGNSIDDPNTTEAILASGTIYDLQVAGKYVTSANASDVLGDGTANNAPTVSYEASTNTLTLNNASLYDQIFWLGSDPLTISLIGKNIIDTNLPCIESDDPVELIINRGNNTPNNSLTLITTWDDDGVLKGFSNTTPTLSTEEGLSWNALSYNQYNKVLEATVATDFDIIINYNTLPIHVTSANADDVFGDKHVSCTYDAANNAATLSLIDAVLYDAATSNKKTTINNIGLSKLTIHFSGNNTIGGNDYAFISSSGEDAELVFESETNGASASTLAIDASNNAILGFTTVSYADGTYLASTSPVFYDEKKKEMADATNAAVGSMTITSTPSYQLWIAGTQITGTYVPANTTFTPATATTPNTLTMTGATINGNIVSSLDNLTIEFSGSNTLDRTAGNIVSMINTATLTFKNVGADNSSQLGLKADGTNSVIQGFASVSCADGTYIRAANPYTYNTYDKRMEDQLGNVFNRNFYVSASPYHPLWIYNSSSYYQAYDDRVNVGGTAILFTASSTTNTLELDNQNNTFTQILSNLDNLTIELTGTNSIERSDTATVIRSLNGAAPLTFTKADDNASLTLKNGSSGYPVLSGFASISYGATDMGWTSKESIDYPIDFQEFVASYDATLNSLVYDNNSTYTAVHNAALVTSYPLWVSGKQVNSTNASNILGGTTGVASFEASTNTLTLNGTSISLSTSSTSPAFKSGLQNLNVVLVGSPQVYLNGESSQNVFEGTVNDATITFQTNGTASGSMYLEAGYDHFFSNITPKYENDLVFFDRDAHSNSYEKAVIKAAPWNGSGTEQDPFQISSLNDLTQLTTEINTNSVIINHQFKLMDNLDCSATATNTFVSIGNSYYTSFKGVFDGNNKTISNLTSTNGLFNVVVNATIKKLTLNGCTVTGSSTGESAAGVVADFRSGTIEDCHVVNSTISSGDNSNITSVGGIAGYARYSCIIKDCSISVNNGGTSVVNQNTGTNAYAGAIIGDSESTTNFTNNTYHAAVTVNGKSGNTQRGTGNGDVFENNGAVLAGVKKITFTTYGTGSYDIDDYYRKDGDDIYLLPYSISGSTTVIEATSEVDYDYPIIAMKDASNGDINGTSNAGTNQATEKDYTDWSFQMPDGDVTATVTFPIDLERDGRVFTIDDTDYSGNAVAITTITTKKSATATTDIALTAGTNFTITKYQDAQGTDIGTTAPSDAGNYKVVITGADICTGTATVDFKINPIAAIITASNETVTYNGAAQAYSQGSIDKGTLVVTYFTSEDNRTNGTNGTTDAPTNANTYYVKLTQGNTNYTVKAENVTFTIDQLDISGADITLDNPELTYNGTEQTVNVTKVEVETLEVGADYYNVSGNKETTAGDYTLTVTAKSGTNNFKGSATATFTIKDRTATITFADGLTYQTYYSATEDCFIPDGVTAYILTGVSETSVTTKKVSYLKKGVALLLEKTAGSTIQKDPTESFDGNLLNYAVDPVDVSGKEYVLYNNEFVKATGTIPATKCYLDVSGPAVARKLSIAHGDDDTVGINDVMLQNDNEDERWYDLQGRRINKPQKAGLYILNGKKISVKSQTK